MTIIVNANIYLHDPETSAVLALMSAKLDSISSQLGIVTATQSQEMDTMTKEFDALQAEVERGTAVDTSVVSLVQGLAAQIEASKDDPTACAPTTTPWRQPLPPTPQPLRLRTPQLDRQRPEDRTLVPVVLRPIQTPAAGAVRPSIP
jgi:hypothetical protein